jgi:hypothetical protein
VAKAAGPARAARSSVVVRAAARANWLPGNDFPAHLENSKLPGNFGFDPLGLGADPERLAWFAESERVHARWAMLGVAGILAQVGEAAAGAKLNDGVESAVQECCSWGWVRQRPSAHYLPAH